MPHNAAIRNAALLLLVLVLAALAACGGAKVLRRAGRSQDSSPL